jgi:hypothetical protein
MIDFGGCRLDVSNGFYPFAHDSGSSEVVLYHQIFQSNLPARNKHLTEMNISLDYDFHI